MYLIKNKYIVKIIATVLTITTIAGGVLPQTANAESTQLYVQNVVGNGSDIQKIGYRISEGTEESIQKRLTSVLGTLDSKISEDERKIAYDFMKAIISFENVRREKKLYTPKKEELAEITKLNKYLNKLTTKYFPEAKTFAEYLEEAYVTKPVVKNPIIENIKSTLSKKDYEKVKKLYTSYAKNNRDFEKTAEDIYKILLKYKSLKADDVLYNIFTAEMGTVAKFTINVSDMSLKYQDPTGTGVKKATKKQISTYKKAWNELRKIIPNSMLKNFREFNISTDGTYGVLAFVQNIDTKGKTWKISVDPADMKDKKAFANTVIHEYGHYLSLNHTQATYLKESEDESSFIEEFDTYKEPMMVAKKDSYINQFYNKYWKEFALDRDINPTNQLFYFRHSDEFVGSYASTSCAEDFAECFSFYVLPSNKKLTKEQQEKLDFFDQFKEVKEMKEKIISNMKKKQNYKIKIIREIIEKQKGCQKI